MAKYLTDELELQSVADAIRAKGGTSESLAFPAGFVSAIEGIPTGGSSSVASAKDVNFRDYDGTITNSYTKEEFANLTEMPANPSHEGLTAQGWNWTLAKAKAYVAKYGKLDIGQMYITDDGKTRIYIHLEKGRTSPRLGVCPNGTVDVDWGDGTSHNTLTGTSVTTVKWTSNHSYAAPGDYVIKLTVTGSMGFYGNSPSNQYAGLLRFSSSADIRNYVYQNSIQKIEIGSGVTSIAAYAFYNCYSLESISIPDSVTNIESYAFNECYSLASINIPNGITSISTCMFNDCYSLASINIPDGVTSIESNAFTGCSSLVSISIPDSVTNIGTYAFSNCRCLAFVSIPNSVTSINNNAFNSCINLVFVSIPNSVTSINNSVFSGCHSLASINIPDSIINIGSYTFSNCYNLAFINIPDGVTNIGGNAFSSCYGVFAYHFASMTPPTLSSTTVFNNMPSDCIFYVPYSEDHSILEAYKTATNWSTYADKIQEEPV